MTCLHRRRVQLLRIAHDLDLICQRAAVETEEIMLALLHQHLVYPVLAAVLIASVATAQDEIVANVVSVTENVNIEATETESAIVTAVTGQIGTDQTETEIVASAARGATATATGNVTEAAKSESVLVIVRDQLQDGQQHAVVQRTAEELCSTAKAASMIFNLKKLQMRSRCHMETITRNASNALAAADRSNLHDTVMNMKVVSSAKRITNATWRRIPHDQTDHREAALQSALDVMARFRVRLLYTH